MSTWDYTKDTAMDETTDRQRSFFGRKTALTVVIFAIVILAIYLYSSNEDEVSLRTLTTSQVVEEKIRRTRTAIGELRASRSEVIAASSDGVFTAVLVSAGSAVVSGTPLGIMKNPVLEVEVRRDRLLLEEAEAKLHARRSLAEQRKLDARASVIEAEAETETLGARVAAEEALLEDGVVSKLAFEETINLWVKSKKTLEIEREKELQLAKLIEAENRAGQLELQRLREEVDARETLLQGLRLLSEQSGIVQEVYVEPGEQVSAGTKVLRISAGELLATLRVSEALSKDISIGMAAEVTVLGEVTRGEVMRIDPVVNQGTVDIDVHLATSQQLGWRPNLSVEAKLLLGGELVGLTLVIPENMRIDGSGNAVVYRLDDTRTLALRTPITYELLTESKILIKSGLSAGDTIISSGLLADYGERLLLTE